MTAGVNNNASKRYRCVFLLGPQFNNLFDHGLHLTEHTATAEPCFVIPLQQKGLLMSRVISRVEPRGAFSPSNLMSL